METQVLVLNSSYMPVNTVSWQKAITWITSGRAVIEDVYEGLFLRSPSTTFPLPSIIRFVAKMTKYFRKGVKFNRRNIWIRDKGQCQYCGKKTAIEDFTFDHVIPKSQGGRTLWQNIVVACYKCNQKKKSRTPQQARMALIQKPFKPKHLAGNGLPGLGRKDIPKSWKDYLGSLKYWTDEVS